jgi:hypothetical protein
MKIYELKNYIAKTNPLLKKGYVLELTDINVFDDSARVGLYRKEYEEGESGFYKLTLVYRFFSFEPDFEFNLNQAVSNYLKPVEANTKGCKKKMEKNLGNVIAKLARYYPTYKINFRNGDVYKNDVLVTSIGITKDGKEGVITPEGLYNLLVAIKAGLI